MRDLAELDVELRRAEDAHLAVNQLKIVLGGFQMCHATFFALVGDGHRREVYRRAGGDGLTAGETAEAERIRRGVARHHLHLVDTDAELGRRDLRHRRAEALCPWLTRR